MLDFSLLGGGGLNPLQMATQGYAQGLQISQAEQQIQAQRQAAMQAQQQAEQEQELLNRAMGGDIQARTEYVLTKFAKDGKQAQEAFGMLDEPRKKEAKNIATQLYTLSETNPQLAREFVKGKITAYENTPNLTPEQQQDLAYYKTMDLVDDDALPYFAGNMVALAMGEDGYKKLAESIAGRKKQPLEMRELGAKVATAESEAKVAPEIANLDILDKKQAIEVKKADVQIKRAEAQLKALEASGYKSPESQLKAEKLRLEIEELNSKKNQAVSERENAHQSAMGDFDSTLDTLYTLKNHKGMAAALGPVDSRFPSLGQETIDFERQLEKLQSQQFLTAVAKVGSMAGLTEVEGKKLQSAIGALDIRMQPETFKRELTKVVDKINQMKSVASKRYGKGDVQKDAITSRSQAVDAILQKYPDATQEQIDAYLATKGL